MSEILFDNSIEGHEKPVALFTDASKKCDLATWHGYCANETKDFDPILSKR